MWRYFLSHSTYIPSYGVVSGKFKDSNELIKRNLIYNVIQGPIHNDIGLEFVLIFISIKEDNSTNTGP